jgi:3',5'-cyclic AMP phosphodiesterase CpdA
MLCPRLAAIVAATAAGREAVGEGGSPEVTPHGRERHDRPMKLLAIADLHLASERNRAALRDLPAYPEDWLIVAGDICETRALFHDALAWLTTRFARVFWAPGNHELWLTDPAPTERSSVAKYRALVAVARSLGVLTPEDPFVAWPAGGEWIVPLCTLYDYSFRPPEVALADVVAWAAERRNVAADERLINPTPYGGMAEWCALRCAETELRMARELPRGARTVLAGHYPLRADLVRIPRIPRFTPWCGTLRTADWHTRFNAVVAISGHLHVRRTDRRDDTRFEEVSLGYPAQWDAAKGVAAYLRQILPPP